MKLVEHNHNILRYKFDRVLYHVATLLVAVVFVAFVANLASQKILKCEYINFNKSQCKITIIKPFVLYYQPKVKLIYNPVKAELITRTGKITYFDVKIANSDNELIFSAYANKDFAINMQKEVDRYIKEHRKTPLIFSIDSSNDFYKAAILCLCALVYQFYTPISINLAVNKKNNLLIVTNNYLGLIIKKRECLLTEIKIIDKQKHRKKSFSIYIETKMGKRIKIRSALSEKEAQQLINRINYFLYSFGN